MSVQTNGNRQESIIKAMSLDKHYAQGSETIRAVDEINFEAVAGDFVVITGRSGSGKTTFLSLIGGLTKPTSGDVFLFGNALHAFTDDQISSLRGEKLGFVFQFSSLIPTLTVLDNLRLPGLFIGKPVDLNHIKDLLGWVGLTDRWSSYPAELSGGQQTRVALCRALANKPQILLADEPTGNLDVDTEHEIMALLKDFNQKNAATILLVTHNPELASYGNRHITMERGKLIEEERDKKMEAVFER